MNIRAIARHFIPNKKMSYGQIVHALGSPNAANYTGYGNQTQAFASALASAEMAVKQEIKMKQSGDPSFLNFMNQRYNEAAKKKMPEQVSKGTVIKRVPKAPREVWDDTEGKIVKIPQNPMLVRA